jgi:mannose-6-phosphate isomerase class I
MASNYDKCPKVAVRGHDGHCVTGSRAIGDVLEGAAGSRVIAVETYPGADDAGLITALREAFRDRELVESAKSMKSAGLIGEMVDRDLTRDPVFGRISNLELVDFFDPDVLARQREKVKTAERPVLVYGVGATLLVEADAVHVYADLARWEIQRRQRAGTIGNLGLDRHIGTAAQKYKRGYFLDWRVADRHKRRLWQRVDYFLDTHDVTALKLVTGPALREGLRQVVRRPFRVVPLFDPGPWGGQWMKEVFDLDRSKANFAWCFDCVPEENSLRLGFGRETFEIPSLDLVFQEPAELLGDAVFGRFGAEFPIRFDFLDTMGGGNLSLQVHPLTEYIQREFGMTYTQDESYYLLDAQPGEASVYLGFKKGINRQEFLDALQAAQAGGPALKTEQYVNQFPARKHDHYLIPAGTIHCSGAGAMVLEISATPYIFTFKLWDWGRMGMDGRPRPIHLDHGARNLQFDRDTAWVKDNLVNQFEPVAHGDGWREERTGLHALEFIETRRHWFTKPVDHHTGGARRGGVNVLNLVAGEAALVESPSGGFDPFEVHYAETFIVPAAVGAYRIRPLGQGEHATVKAFVRSRA